MGVSRNISEALHYHICIYVYMYLCISVNTLSLMRACD